MHYANPKYLSILIFLTIVVALFYLWAMQTEKKAPGPVCRKISGRIDRARLVSVQRKIIKMIMLTTAICSDGIFSCKASMGIRMERDEVQGA